MKKTCVLLITLFTAVHSQAALIAYEGFDYGTRADTDLNGGSEPYNGGTGWNGAWVKVNGATGDYVEGTNLTYGALQTSGGSFLNENAGVTYTRLLSSAISDATSNQTVWFSMLAYRSSSNGYRVIEWTNSASGETRMSFGNNNNDTSGEWEVGSADYDDGNETGVTGSTSSATPDLIVGKIDLFTGTGTNDNITLFVNPTIGGAIPTGGTSYDLGDSARSIDRFRFISGTIGGTGLDEIRLGDTFGDVTVIPEPSTMVLVGIVLGTFLIFRRRR